MINTNIKGLLYLTRLILPSMIEHNQGTITILALLLALTPILEGMSMERARRL